MNLAQPDITLHLDLDGIIRDVNLSGSIPENGVTAWIGSPWTQTVGDVSADKIKLMIEHARKNGMSAFRQLNQQFPSGQEIPIEYTTIRVSDSTGLVAIGKSLQTVAELQSRLISAQQAMERDYWKFREIETRYRLLFDASNEAVLIVRAANMHIVEANPVAIRTLGLMAGGRDFRAELRQDEREEFEKMLETVREHGKSPRTIFHLGQNQEAWLVSASLMTADPGPVFLLQLTPFGKLEEIVDNKPTVAAGDILDRAPDAIVATTDKDTIQYANPAFLNLVQVNDHRSVIGKTLSRWIGRAGADMTALMSRVADNGYVRLFPTTLESELGTQTDVEISAARNGEADPPSTSFVIRDVSARLAQPSIDRSAALPDTTSAHLGVESLQTVVRKAVDSIEQRYIEAALVSTRGNRSAAADLLGLSRQALYAKLNRYGLDGRT